MTDDVLRQQLEYYRARAQEYDESVQQTGRFASEEPPDPEIDAEWARMMAALRGVGRVGNALELACGTGAWTQELVQIAQTVTALDGSQEMLDVHRAKVDDSRVRYVCADLFNWQPEQEYDLVFFGFWLSHVPPDKLASFLDSVRWAVRPGGRVFIVDEPAGGKQLSGPVEGEQYQTRTLYDGRSFRIVKVYYDPQAIRDELEQRGFEQVEAVAGEYFFHLTGRREA